jgi:ABC-type Mn2+/Zn2+ transport system permease subunit
MRNLNLTKVCGIAGIFLGEIYMVFTVLAPGKTTFTLIEPLGALLPVSILAPANLSGSVPLDHQVWRMVILSVFFGVFGGLVGTGIGLLLSNFTRRH